MTTRGFVTRDLPKLGANLGRRLILALARSPSVRAFVHRHGMRLGAGRFVAGETLAEALQVASRLNAQGLKVALNYLGENVHDPRSARETTTAYLQLIEGIAAGGIDATVSLKLTQMGLTVAEQLALENVSRVVAHASAHGNFVRIDMEESAHVDATLRIYRHLRPRWENVGVVIQAYLYRSARDLEDLARMRANVRLVKGAYAEPPDVAYPSKAEVDANFRRLIAFYLKAGPFTAIATHDERAIDFARRWATDHGIDRSRYEFQMLYGVRPGLQRALAAAGETVRVYVPYGSEWYPYLMRRLAERPANLAFLVRNLFKR